MIDATPYLSIPWLRRGRTLAGADCYGIVRVLYDRQFDIQLPAYDDSPMSDSDTIASSATEWLPIEPGHERDGDVVLISRGVEYDHVGVVVGPKQLLHAREDRFPQVADYSRRLLWGNSTFSFYRHPRRVT